MSLFHLLCHCYVSCLVSPLLVHRGLTCSTTPDILRDLKGPANKLMSVKDHVDKWMQAKDHECNVRIIQIYGCKPMIMNASLKIIQIDGCKLKIMNATSGSYRYMDASQ